MKKGFRNILAIVFGLFSISVTAATISEDDLKGHLAFELPRTWKLTEFEVTISQNMGSEASPLVKSRFEAKIKARDNFFKHVRWEDGGVEVIQLIAKNGDELPLYGDATSTKSGAVWNVKFDFERAVHKEGKTRSSFATNAIVKGSTEEKELLAKKNAAQAKKAQQAANAEAARRANEEKMAKARAEAEKNRLAAMNAEIERKQQRELRYQQLLAKYNPKQIPGVISNDYSKPLYTQFPLHIGDVYYFESTGRNNYGVYGGDPYYSVYSDIDGAAIHAGLRANIDKAIVKVTIVKYDSDLLGSNKNGIRADNRHKQYSDGKAMLVQAVHDRDFNEIELKTVAAASSTSQTSLKESEKRLKESTKKLEDSLRKLFGK